MGGGINTRGFSATMLVYRACRYVILDYLWLALSVAFAVVCVQGFSAPSIGIACRLSA